MHCTKAAVMTETTDSDPVDAGSPASRYESDPSAEPVEVESLAALRRRLLTESLHPDSGEPDDAGWPDFDQLRPHPW